jgi:hypothetical protein
LNALDFFSHTPAHHFKERGKKIRSSRRVKSFGTKEQRGGVFAHLCAYIRREHLVKIEEASERGCCRDKKREKSSTMRARIGVFDYPEMRENEYNDGGGNKQKASAALPLLLLARGYSLQNTMNGRVTDISSHGRKPPFLDITCTRVHTPRLCARVGLFVTLAFTYMYA